MSLMSAPMVNAFVIACGTHSIIACIVCGVV